MLNMNELAARLSEVMQELSLQKPKELADFCGVSEGLVSQWFSGTTKLGPKPLKAFARTHFSLDWLTDGRLPKYRSGAEGQTAVPAAGHPDMPAGAMRVVLIDEDSDHLYRIPKVELRLKAGVTGFQTEPDRRDGGTMGLSRSWADRKGYDPEQLMAIQVKGESMEPTFYEGDTVVINLADKKPVDNGVFAINYDGEAVVKRLSRDAGQWWLMSDNTDQQKFYRRMCRGTECIIIGRIVRREGDHF